MFCPVIHFILYSLRTEIEKNRKFMEEHDILKKQYNTMKEEQEKLKKSFKELQEKFDKMEKEKSKIKIMLKIRLKIILKKMQRNKRTRLIKNKIIMFEKN